MRERVQAESLARLAKELPISPSFLPLLSRTPPRRRRSASSPSGCSSLPSVPFTYEFPRPAVTVTASSSPCAPRTSPCSSFSAIISPFRGAWALPGGFVDRDESLDRAAARELQEETGVTGVRLEQLGAFGDPGRDPRGHTITVAFYSFVVADAQPVAADDAADAKWVRSLAPALLVGRAPACASPREARLRSRAHHRRRARPAPGAPGRSHAPIAVRPRPRTLHAHRASARVRGGARPQD